MQRDTGPGTGDLVAEVEAFLRHDPGLRTRPGTPLDERFAALVDYQRRLHAAGLAVPAWPVEFGGRALAPGQAAEVNMALGRGGAPELINFVGTDVLAPALFAFGRRADLLRWMPAMASAQEIWCQLFSEPDAGSDLTNLRTRAQPMDDGTWRVTGGKVWSTWAQFARWGLLLARTGSIEARHRGITAFVVDMRSPGITIRPLATMTGAAEFAEVHLDDVHLSADAVVGQVDGGWAAAQTILNAERGPYAVRRAAVIGRALTNALDRARTAPVGPAARTELIGAVIAYRLLELRIRGVVEQLAAGAEVGPESAVTKLLMTDAEQRVMGASAAMLGPVAAAWDGDADGDDAASVVEEYLYSRAASIYGGTSQIQRNIIGERLLGLPREPVA
jgi:alkylation response protein AidB-like acyl-CoA dehydrogenase